MRALRVLPLSMVGLLVGAVASAQWCVPGIGPTLMNSYGPSSPTITNVKLGTIDRSSPPTAKELYIHTGLATDLTPGESYDFSLSHEPDASFCPVYQLRVWIDWNLDGVFGDSEAVVSRNNYGPRELSSPIAVPVDAVIGLTRMRVAQKMELDCGHHEIMACPMPEPFGWHGEIEDYDINVVAGPGCDTAGPVALLTAVKTAGDVSLSWEPDPGFASYSAYAVLSGEPSRIRDANRAGESAFPSEVANVCREVPGGCSDPGRVRGAPSLVFYQVVGVCSTGEEGPNG